MLSAVGKAYRNSLLCHKGICGSNLLLRNFQYNLLKSEYSCNKYDVDRYDGTPIVIHPESGTFAHWDGESSYAYTWSGTRLVNVAINDKVVRPPGKCLARTLAHEATHTTMEGIPFWAPSFISNYGGHPFGPYWMWGNYYELKSAVLIRALGKDAEKYPTSEVMHEAVYRESDACDWCKETK